MTAAAVKFSRKAYDLYVSLIAEDGKVLAVSTSVEAIAHEVAMLGIVELHLTETFSVSLPTNYATLAQASAIDFEEPLAVFILISACAW
ncbi:MAG: hypothetical protein V4476_24160 [Pseudomonadota bacterium]